MCRILFVCCLLLNALSGFSQAPGSSKQIYLKLSDSRGKAPKKVSFYFSDPAGHVQLCQPASPRKGEYIFSNIPAGYNAITIQSRGNYTAGFQWWTEIPDSASIRLQSMKHGYGYMDSNDGVTSLELTGNLIWIKLKPGTTEERRLKITRDAGLEQSQWTNTYTVQSSHPLQPFNNNWLAQLRKDTSVEECGPVAYITGIKSPVEKKKTEVTPKRFVSLSNTVAMQFDDVFYNMDSAFQEEYIGQLTLRYNLSQDAMQRVFNPDLPVLPGDLFFYDCDYGISTGIFNLVEQLRKEKYIKAAEVYFISP